MQCVQDNGGVLSLEDLREHKSTFDTPIKTTYRDVDVWEMPPNGQGITALMALNILEGFVFSGERSKFHSHVSRFASIFTSVIPLYTQA